MDNPYQAPRGEILTPTGGQNPLTWKQILFSFQGRIPRRQYWGGSLVIVLIAAVPVGIIAALAESESTASQVVVAVIGIALAVFYFWSIFAITTKRWHDRDKSGWWFLINFLPIIGGFWALIENGFLRGTEGPNRYGDDPT